MSEASQEVKAWCAAIGARGGKAGSGRPKRYSHAELLKRAEILRVAREKKHAKSLGKHEG